MGCVIVLVSKQFDSRLGSHFNKPSYAENLFY